MDVRRQGQVRDDEVTESPAHILRDRRGGGILARIVAVVFIVLALATLGWFGSKTYGALTADSAVKTKQYQAVFLTNGQVYFGKVTKLGGDYVKLTDIYYLQVQQTVQPKDTTAAANPQVSLAKLGGELHGPEDAMYIAHQQVLFWENLKTDGKVAQAIANYKATGK